MRNRGVAILLCGFLGAFGAHKFYLGQHVAGLMYVLFIWTLIPSILAFIEFFMLIFMKEETFQRTYNKPYVIKQ